MDNEKIINGLKTHGKKGSGCLECPYANEEGGTDSWCLRGLHRDILALLKEQENREQNICKEICDFIRGSCSTDTEDDKDFVCYEIQKCFSHFCADGVRKICR